MPGFPTTATVQHMLEAAGKEPWRLDHPRGWMLSEYGMGFRLLVMRDEADQYMSALPLEWRFSVLQQSEDRIAFYVKPGRAPRAHWRTAAADGELPL